MSPTEFRELTRQTAAQLTTQDAEGLAQHFVKSGWFQDASDPSKAVVKILAGQEMGIGPMAAMQGIHIIEGKPSMSANLLASQVKRHPAYDFIPLEVTEKHARIDFLQNGESIGTSEFTMEDAARAGIAGKQNFKRYPRAMLFARALSQGVRWYCPDVTAGSPAYVPEELGAEVTVEGEPVEAEVSPELAASADPADVPGTHGDLLGAEVLLDAERVEHIVSGFAAEGLTYAKIDLLLGAHDIDGLRAHSAKAVRERLESLSLEQADAVESELEMGTE